MSEWVLSKFNGTSTPKGSYRAKRGDNDCNVNSSRYSLKTALCESIRYQTKSEQNVRQDPIPRVRHGEAALCTPNNSRDWERNFTEWGNPPLLCQKFIGDFLPPPVIQISSKLSHHTLWISLYFNCGRFKIPWYLWTSWFFCVRMFEVFF